MWYYMLHLSASCNTFEFLKCAVRLSVRWEDLMSHTAYSSWCDYLVSCFSSFLFCWYLFLLLFLFSESSSSSSGSESESDEKRPVFKQDSLVEGTSSRYSMYNSVSQKLMVGQKRFGPNYRDLMRANWEDLSLFWDFFTVILIIIIVRFSVWSS